MNNATANPEPGILATCQDLHMLATGSMDGISLADSDKMAAWLQGRLDRWRATTGTYDGLVKALATIALAEYQVSREAALRHRRESARVPDDHDAHGGKYLEPFDRGRR